MIKEKCYQCYITGIGEIIQQENIGKKSYFRRTYYR